MVITESTIYWITRLGSVKAGIQNSGSVMCVVFIILGVASAIVYLAGNDFDNEHVSKWGEKWFPRSVLLFLCGLLFIIASCFIPTTKEMCAIKVLPIIANNDEVQNLPNRVVELTNDWLDELSPDNVINTKVEQKK